MQHEILKQNAEEAVPPTSQSAETRFACSEKCDHCTARGAISNKGRVLYVESLGGYEEENRIFP